MEKIKPEKDLKGKLSEKFSFKKGLYTFINLYSIQFMWQNPSLFNKFNNIYIDGKFLQLIMKFKGYKISKRISFDYTSIADDVFKNILLSNSSLAIIGSSDNSVKYFVEFIKKKYSNINVTYYRNGYFKNDERDEAISTIIKLKIDVVICGMGTPLQEQFLAELVDKDWTGIGYTCGGFIHQTSINGDKYYPFIINKLNLRFLYRIYKEPYTLKRYLFSYPVNLAKILFNYNNY